MAAFIGTSLAREPKARAQWVVREVPTTTIARLPIYLQAGREYQIETFGLGTGVDPVLHLLDANNWEVAQNDDYAPPNRNSRVFYSPPTTGYFYVVVRGYTQYSGGIGGVRYSSRLLPSGPWTAWADLSSSSWFGGTVVLIQTGQREYRSVMRQPAAGGTTDVVMYAIDWWDEITNYDDDGGVGYMSRLTFGFSSYPTYSLLVGAYSTPGTTDVMANDALDVDRDYDGVGPGLESALGTCDGVEDTAPRCRVCANPLVGPCPPNPTRTLINFQDSDHDGLTDSAEAFGIDNVSEPWNALHLPAWGADPRRKDVFIEQDYSTAYANTDPNPFTYSLATKAREKFCGTASGPCTLPTEQEVMNLAGGGNGIHLHFDIGQSGDPCPLDRTLCGAWGGGGQRVSGHTIATPRATIFRHMIAHPSGGATYLANKTVDFGMERPEWNLVHELGHSLGLTHGGHWKWDFASKSPYHPVDMGNVELNGKPHYRSLMNYTWFNADYNASPSRWASFNFSRGQNTATIDPANILETASPFAAPGDAAYMQYDANGHTDQLLPLASGTTGQGDWSRDGELPTLGALRGVMVSGGAQESTHRLSVVESTP